jgi:hypothetical protein
LLIERYGYRILDYRLTAEGCCPSCGTAVAGRWLDRFGGQITEQPFVPSSGRHDQPFRIFSA